MQAAENLQEHRVLSTVEFANSDVVSVHSNHSFIALVQASRAFRHDLWLSSTMETLWWGRGLFTHQNAHVRVSLIERCNGETISNLDPQLIRFYQRGAPKL